MLNRCEEVVLDGSAARAAGRLCGETGTADVIDASVALAVAEASDTCSEVVLLTSDTRDLTTLLAALSVGARVVSL
jgi:glutamine amidotransferase PdxT